MTIKFIKVLLEWLFVPHGYIDWQETPGIGKNITNRAIGVFGALNAKPQHNTCNVCGREFWALKKLPTCMAIRCFFSYRMKTKKKLRKRKYKGGYDHARVYK